MSPPKIVHTYPPKRRKPKKQASAADTPARTTQTESPQQIGNGAGR